MRNSANDVRMTDRARLALWRAAAVARRLESNVVLPPHVLLTLVRFRTSTACYVLQCLGIDLLCFQAELSSLASAMTRTQRPTRLGNRVSLSRSLRIAVNAFKGKTTIGTEHLLLASLHRPAHKLRRLLSRFDVTECLVKRELARYRRSVEIPRCSRCGRPAYECVVEVTAPDVNVVSRWLCQQCRIMVMDNARSRKRIGGCK